MSLFREVSGYWDRIYRHYNIPITHGNKHYKGPCPLCGKTNKFRLFNDWIATGGYICTCSSSGNGIVLLMHLKNLTYKEICHELIELLDLNQENLKLKPVEDENIKHIEIFRAMPKPENTDVEKYLVRRGINILPFMSVRFSTEQKFYGTTSYPAMYAIATNDKGSVIYYHCTYLQGAEKIAHSDAKKMFKVSEGYGDSLAVKMFPHKKVLGIAEGIETALSCAQRYDVPVWSTLNSTYLKKFRAPKGVSNLLVFADNDSNGTGLSAAFDCARSNILLPNDVVDCVIIWPRERGDFNDMDMKVISEKIVKWKLNK